MNFEKISVTYQHDSMQCGTACLQMICNFFGREYTMDSISKLCFATTEGVSLLDINEAANTLGLRTISQCKWTFCPNILDFASIRNVPIQRSCKYFFRNLGNSSEKFAETNQMCPFAIILMFLCSNMPVGSL